MPRTNATVPSGDEFAAPDSVSDAGLTITARWEKPLVPSTGGEGILLVRINAAPQPERDSSTRRAPIDVAFVLDRSGSMAGERLALAKEAVDVAVSHLGDEDRAALVVYDQAVETLQRLDRATSRTKTALRLALHGVDAGGSTDLGTGWLTGCGELSRDLPDARPGADGADGGAVRLRRALLLTDGLANVGITNPAELTHHAAELRKRGVATTTLGVGLGFNEDLLAGMAEAGGGNFQFVERADQLRAFFERELSELLTIVAAGPSLTLTLPSGVEGRLVNAFPTTGDGEDGGTGPTGRRLNVSLRDLAAGDALDLIFVLTVDAAALGTTRYLHLTATWADPATDSQRTAELRPAPLTHAEPTVIAATEPDPDVAGPAARQRAAAAHQAAIRLDREGRYAESRARLREGVAFLMAAPASADLGADLNVAQFYASHVADAPMPESTRKRAMSDSHRRSRGNRE